MHVGGRRDPWRFAEALCSEDDVKHPGGTSKNSLVHGEVLCHPWSLKRLALHEHSLKRVSIKNY